MNRPKLILALTATLLTLFLGFIDEGYYNFNFLFEWGNWLALAPYWLVIFLVELGIYFLVLNTFPNNLKHSAVWLAIIIGICLPLGLIAYLWQ